MSRKRKQRSGLSTSQAQTAAKNADAIREVVDGPDHEPVNLEAELPTTYWRRFVARDLVERVGSSGYVFDERVFDVLPDSDGPWPRCPHRGLSNLGRAWLVDLGDNAYSCSAEWCEATYSRSEAEAAMRGDGA